RQIAGLESDKRFARGKLFNNGVEVLDLLRGRRPGLRRDAEDQQRDVEVFDAIGLAHGVLPFTLNAQPLRLRQSPPEERSGQASSVQQSDAPLTHFIIAEPRSRPLAICLYVTAASVLLRFPNGLALFPHG